MSSTGPPASRSYRRASSAPTGWAVEAPPGPLLSAGTPPSGLRAARSRVGQGCGVLARMSPGHVTATSQAALSDYKTTSSSRTSFQCEVRPTLS